MGWGFFQSWEAATEKNPKIHEVRNRNRGTTYDSMLYMPSEGCSVFLPKRSTHIYKKNTIKGVHEKIYIMLISSRLILFSNYHICYAEIQFVQGQWTATVSAQKSPTFPNHLCFL